MTKLGAMLAVLSVAVLILSGPGTRWGWWHFKTGLLLFAASFLIGLAAFLLSGIAWLRSHPNPTAAVASIVSAVVLVLPLTQIVLARGKPRIHDISTDLADPPRFSAILPLRADAPNKVPDRADEATASQQRAGYPGLTTLDLSLPADSAFAKAADAAKASGWEIVSTRPAEGILEATDTTAFFGFHDDIVVRIRRDGEHSRVDVRSVSRVGVGDAGKNADRITKYLRRMAS